MLNYVEQDIMKAFVEAHKRIATALESLSESLKLVVDTNGKVRVSASVHKPWLNPKEILIFMLLRLE